MARRAARGALSRDRVLEAALRVVDSAGVGALTMRRVAAELGVDPMALYRYVPGKDGLLDGVVELIWRRVPAPPRRRDEWAEPLRAFLHALRAVLAAHPAAAPLLLTRPVFPRPALEAFHTLLLNLRDAGFDEPRAAQILRGVTATAIGDALTTLTHRALTRSPVPAGPQAESDAMVLLAQALPDDTPPELVRTAYAICGTEPGDDFPFLLDLILDGARRVFPGAATRLE